MRNGKQLDLKSKEWGIWNRKKTWRWHLWQRTLLLGKVAPQWNLVIGSTAVKLQRYHTGLIIMMLRLQKERNRIPGKWPRKPRKKEERAISIKALRNIKPLGKVLLAPLHLKVTHILTKIKSTITNVKNQLSITRKLQTVIKDTKQLKVKTLSRWNLLLLGNLSTEEKFHPGTTRPSLEYLYTGVCIRFQALIMNGSGTTGSR